MALRAIVINGTGGSGKDQLVEYCTEILNQGNLPKVYNLSSITPVKEMLKAQGWDGVTKNPKIRKKMSDMKLKLILEDRDYFNRYLLGEISKIEEARTQDWNSLGEDGPMPEGIVFIHIREVDEIKRFREVAEESGIETLAIHVSRPGVEVTGNISDEGTYNYNRYDYSIQNDGTLEDLYSTAGAFLTKLGLIEEDTETKFETNQLSEGNPQRLITQLPETK